MSRTVNCAKLGREAEGLDYAPWPGELGKRIYENISKEAVAAWATPVDAKSNEMNEHDYVYERGPGLLRDPEESPPG